MAVGVLSLQGDFAEHIRILRTLKRQTVEVRLPIDLAHVDRIIIPGGESTTIGNLLRTAGLLRPLADRIKNGMPVWGTCAGAILLAKRIADGKPNQVALRAIDITARRNAFGRQLDSFETVLTIPSISKNPLSVAFIRAPLFEKPGKEVEVLARLPNGQIVVARENNVLVTSFHPEISGDAAVHRYFLSF